MSTTIIPLVTFGYLSPNFIAILPPKLWPKIIGLLILCYYIK